MSRLRLDPAIVRAFLTVILTLLVIPPAAMPAFAATPDYADWKVELWPEYDDPRTLVIFSQQLDQSTPLPFRFSYSGFPLDAQVGMACQVTGAGEHQCQNQQVNVEGDKKTISYTAPSERKLFLEYYTDMLDGERPDQRTMEYTFTAPADISYLEVAIRQPKDATGFKATPAYTERRDGEGFTVSVFSKQNVKAGEEFTVAFEYTRPTWEPLVAPLSETGGAPGAGTQARGESDSSLALIVGGLALIAATILVLARRPARR